MRGTLILTLMMSLAQTARAGDDGCGGLVRSLAEAAAKRSVRRVAVVPFLGPRGGASYAGSVLAERLVTGLIMKDGLEIVERPLLETVMQEQRRSLFGIMDPKTAKALGKVLGVDAILTGTAVELKGGRFEVNARLIHAETAQVLAAARGQVKKDWESPVGAEDGSMIVAVPELVQLDDKPKACRERENKLEESLLPLKARFWADKLRDPGFSPAQLKRNPGSEIRDAGLREKFYSELRRLYYDGHSEPLSVTERGELAHGLEELKVVSEICDG